MSPLDGKTSIYGGALVGALPLIKTPVMKFMWCVANQFRLNSSVQMC